MLKCLYNECRWPECDKTCGLVPPGDYAVGSCPEEGLIYHLQNEVARMKNIILTTRIHASRINTNALEILKSCPAVDTYERTCPYGYQDCVYDPGYLRAFYPEEWVEDGMPTTCGESCGGKDGGYCNNYDWEDK